jgi:hypothetical protein
MIEEYIKAFRENDKLVIYCNKTVYNQLKKLLTTKELKRVFV